MKTLDAGQLREQLAYDLADWQAAEFKSSEFANRFHRRVATLSRMTGFTKQEVMADLREDAEQLAD